MPMSTVLDPCVDSVTPTDSFKPIDSVLSDQTSESNSSLPVSTPITKSHVEYTTSHSNPYLISTVSDLQTVVPVKLAMTSLQSLPASCQNSTTALGSCTESMSFQSQPRSLPKVECQASARIPSYHGPGTHRLHIYSNTHDSKEHMALVFGSSIISASLNKWLDSDTRESRMMRGANPELKRVESELNDDAVSPLLQEAMRMMSNAGSGVILYLIQEGRGIGLKNKLMAYNLIDMGHDTLSANVALGHLPDERSYAIASAMLADLGVFSIRLLTNNPHKVHELEMDGISIVERIPMIPTSWQQRHEAHANGSDFDQDELNHQPNSIKMGMQDRDDYLVAKVKRMGHILDIPISLTHTGNDDQKQ
ncbi:hypothetical protein BDV3_005772 [Batrachochytrium dendrobatidis]